MRVGVGGMSGTGDSSVVVTLPLLVWGRRRSDEDRLGSQVLRFSGFSEPAGL